MKSRWVAYAAMVAAAAEQQTATTNDIASTMTANVQGASRVTEDGCATKGT